MNKLENRIRKERDALDSFEPSEGHMDRFSAKLGIRKTSLFARIPYPLKVAAVLMLVAASSILVYEQVSLMYSRQKVVSLSEISEEFSEAEYYYTSLIEEKYQAIDRFVSEDPLHKEMLMNELDEMDRLFQSLQEDLQTNPTDERIIHTMIYHYQLKLEVMGRIVTQLEKVKNVNNNKYYENTEI